MEKDVIIRCPKCNNEMIWVSSADAEDLGLEEDFSMVSAYSCAECGCEVEIYYPKEDINDKV